MRSVKEHLPGDTQRVIELLRDDAFPLCSARIPDGPNFQTESVDADPMEERSTCAG